MIQDKRISCADALYHPFLDDGRIRYHTFLCSCCITHMGSRHFCRELEPSSSHKFDPMYERELTSLSKAKCETTIIIVPSLCKSLMLFYMYLLQFNYTNTFALPTLIRHPCLLTEAPNTITSFKGE